MSDDAEGKSGEKGFKFADKRRFDSEGNDKELISDHADFGTRQEVSGEGEEYSIDFSSFIMSLATQGMMQLGEMPAPSGVSIPADPAMAKQTIDILSMLREKTKGNLDEYEDQLFEEILHNIRMMYVKKSVK